MPIRAGDAGVVHQNIATEAGSGFRGVGPSGEFGFDVADVDGEEPRCRSLRALISSCSCFPRFSPSMSASMMLAPSSAARMAIAVPIPPAAPVERFLAGQHDARFNASKRDPAPANARGANAGDGDELGGERFGFFEACIPNRRTRYETTEFAVIQLFHGSRLAKRLIAGMTVGVAAASWMRFPSGAAEFSYKWGIGTTKTHPVTLAVLQATERIRRVTNRRVEIKIYPYYILGSDSSMLLQIREGALEFVTVANGNLAQLVPVAGISTIPYFSSYKAGWAAMDGKLGAAIADAIEASMYFQRSRTMASVSSATASGRSRIPRISGA